MSGTTVASPLIEPDWLNNNLNETGVQVIDAAWYLPTQSRDASADYEKKRIPSAVHFKIDEICAPEAGPPNRMLPDPEQFADQCGALGVRDDAHLVIYDHVGFYSAARVWWMFVMHGHDNVSVLNGGLPAWVKNGFPVISGPADPPIETTYSVHARKNLRRTWQEVQANMESGAETLIDVRPGKQYYGSAADLYPGVRDGHIPGARNFYFAKILNEDRSFKSAEEIKTILAENEIDLSQPTISTCGSGVTACVLPLIARLIHQPEPAVYDGSWEEWGNRHDLPASTT